MPSIVNGGQAFVSQFRIGGGVKKVSHLYHAIYEQPLSLVFVHLYCRAWRQPGLPCQYKIMKPILSKDVHAANIVSQPQQLLLKYLWYLKRAKKVELEYNCGSLSRDINSLSNDYWSHCPMDIRQNPK